MSNKNLSLQILIFLILTDIPHRYVTFQMAEVTINKKIFTEILFRIDQLRYRTV